MTELFNFKTV